MEVNRASISGKQTPSTAGMESTAATASNANKASIKSDNSIQTVEELKLAERQGQNIPISDEQLIKAIQRAIKEIQGPQTELQFSVHEKTKQIVVKVMDKDTGKVIREIPPEKNLDFLAKLCEKAGILIDERI